MPAASGGLVFTFGLGAIAGPLMAGWAMQGIGAFAFWLVLGGTFGLLALYALYRMSQRATAPCGRDRKLSVRGAHGLGRRGRGGRRRAAEQAEAEREEQASS